MSELKEYLISHAGLQEGEHVFEYNIRDSFFDVYKNNDVQGAELLVRVLFNKKKTHIEISFDIDGEIALNCDRCLDLFNEKVKIRQSVFIKFKDKGSDDNGSEDENLYVLPENQTEINLAEFIDELIAVNLPMRRIHPKDKDGKPTCSQKMLNYIENINNNGSQIDPRWNELNKLKDGTS